MKRRGEDTQPAVRKSTVEEMEKGKGVKTEEVYRYWWCCNGAAQNEGKGCGMWQVMDVDAEGRGPFVRDRTEVTDDLPQRPVL